MEDDNQIVFQIQNLLHGLRISGFEGSIIKLVVVTNRMSHQSLKNNFT